MTTFILPWVLVMGITSSNMPIIQIQFKSREACEVAKRQLYKPMLGQYYLKYRVAECVER